MEEKADKKNRILEAAKTIFSRKGFHQATVEEIARLADVGKGTVYEYFSSKLEIFQEMFTDLMNEYAAELGMDFGGDDPVREKIRCMLEAHLRFLVENREFTLVAFGELGGADEELVKWMYEIRRQKIARLKTLFDEGIARGEIVPLDTGLAADALAGVMRGLSVPVLLENRPCDPPVVARTVSGIFFEGIGSVR